MNQDFQIDMVTPKCPIRHVLSRICDNWSIWVLCVLDAEGILCFSMIQKRIPDISQKMLTITLRTLEDDGLVTRKVYAEIPPRVEYKLTTRGSYLIPLLKNLVLWAKENMDGIMQNRTKK